MKIHKREKGDLSIITAITFAFLLTSLVFLFLTSSVEENFFVRRDQAKDQVMII